MKILVIKLLFCLFAYSTHAQVWQWSVKVQSVSSTETNDHPQAFLWIPEDCKYVRGLVVGQHNMLEEGIFEHPDFRRKLAQLGFAEVWVTPALTIVFDFNNGAGAQFQDMMNRLADVSGYRELTFAPVVPIGHSALASYPWNFAAWSPGRTLAAISVHGDAPLTKLTGSGRPNPDWVRHAPADRSQGSKTIEGVPGLMVMGEYEWWEDRLAPAFAYVTNHPKTPFSLLADAGRGHFDNSDQMVNFLALYIEKAAKYRLPNKSGQQDSVVLKPINPRKGWLLDRWRKDTLPTASAAPFMDYKGDKRVATWCFDKDMAEATEAIYQQSRGKKPQHVGFLQNNQFLEPKKTHGNYLVPFLPESDGITFHLKSTFTDSSRVQPTGAHANTRISIDRICGPVRKLNDTTFQISFYRLGFNNSRRSNDIWLLASNNGDKTYKSIVQQADLQFPLINKEGKPQTITFAEISDRQTGVKFVSLNAVSDAQLPVSYYIKEGPAVIEGNQLLFTKIPPRSKLPMKVTVVAWQYGASVGTQVQSAVPIERTFFIR